MFLERRKKKLQFLSTRTILNNSKDSISTKKNCTIDPDYFANNLSYSHYALPPDYATQRPDYKKHKKIKDLLLYAQVVVKNNVSISRTTSAARAARLL